MARAVQSCYSPPVILMESTLTNEEGAKRTKVKKPKQGGKKPRASAKNHPQKANRDSVDNTIATILAILDKQSAEDIVNIDLRDKSSVADCMIVASGRSNRHVNALADYIQRGLKEIGIKKLGIEGAEQCDWVLIDIGDVIVHVFRPEVRAYYALEKLWSVPPLKTSPDTSSNKTGTS